MAGNVSIVTRKYTLLVICTAVSFVITQSAPEGALVTSVPGFNGTLPSKHYAGYVTTDESHGRKLYYYFVVSERSPSQDPVVLWLNGGPGCSSFDGFVYEHGPFNFEAGKTSDSLPTLHLNPYSWSKVSNIVYLDSPAGVGFSYSGNKSDYITGDIQTASDSHTFLLKWFELYPEFLSNPFYIAGESYAGVYVPTLSYEVAKGIDEGVKPVLNFKGYMVGNGVTDEEYDGNALVPFAHGMGLISDDLYKEVTSECHGNYYNPASDSCASKLAKVDQEVDGINIYDILEPCYYGPDTIKMLTGNTKLPLSFRKLGETERPLPVRTRMFGRAWPLRAPVRDGLVPTWPQLLNGENVPCTVSESDYQYLPLYCCCAEVFGWTDKCRIMHVISRCGTLITAIISVFQNFIATSTSSCKKALSSAIFQAWFITFSIIYLLSTERCIKYLDTWEVSNFYVILIANSARSVDWISVISDYSYRLKNITQ